jgi:hypothetical protein
MTDKLHYPDLFTTINIPKTEVQLALKAKNLFDIAHVVGSWDPAVSRHLIGSADYVDSSQLQWVYENTKQQTIDRLSILIIQRGMIIALEHRDRQDHSLENHTSISLSGGITRVFEYDTQRLNQKNEGSTTIPELTSFKQFYFQTAANLGLYHHIKEIHEDHIESNEAIWPSAA